MNMFQILGWVYNSSSATMNTIIIGWELFLGVFNVTIFGDFQDIHFQFLILNNSYQKNQWIKAVKWTDY